MGRGAELFREAWLIHKGQWDFRSAFRWSNAKILALLGFDLNNGPQTYCGFSSDNIGHFS